LNFRHCRLTYLAQIFAGVGCCKKLHNEAMELFPIPLIFNENIYHGDSISIIKMGRLMKKLPSYKVMGNLGMRENR